VFNDPSSDFSVLILQDELNLMAEKSIRVGNWDGFPATPPFLSPACLQSGIASGDPTVSFFQLFC